MPRLDTDSLSLPFSGNTPISRHCSFEGAQKALPKAGSQAMVVLVAIKDHGPLTDHELVMFTGFPLNVVNARRHELLRKGLIHAAGSIKGSSGVRNTTWAFGAQP